MNRYYFLVGTFNLAIAVLLCFGIPSRLDEFLILVNAFSSAFYYKESFAVTA